MVSVEDIGEHKVYNLTVGPDHTYVANGIITHNTGKDAVFDSSLLALTPMGLINALGAKKSDTMDMDKDTMAMAGDSYSGASDTIMDAGNLSGKKFGLFSRKELAQANREIANAGRL